MVTTRYVNNYLMAPGEIIEASWMSRDPKGVLREGELIKSVESQEISCKCSHPLTKDCAHLVTDIRCEELVSRKIRPKLKSPERNFKCPEHLWNLIAGDTSQTLPISTLKYIYRLSWEVDAGCEVPTSVPIWIRHSLSPIAALQTTEIDARKLGTVSQEDFNRWYKSIRNQFEKAKGVIAICDLSIHTLGPMLSHKFWQYAAEWGEMGRLIELASEDELGNLVASLAREWSHGFDAFQFDVDASISNGIDTEIQLRLQWLRSLFAYLDNVDINTETMTPKTGRIFEKALGLLRPRRKVLLLWMWSGINPAWTKNLFEMVLCTLHYDEGRPSYGSRRGHNRKRAQRSSKLVAHLILLGMQRATPGNTWTPYLASVPDMLCRCLHMKESVLRGKLEKTEVGKIFVQAIKNLQPRREKWGEEELKAHIQNEDRPDLLDPMELDKMFTAAVDNPEPRCERAPGSHPE